MTDVRLFPSVHFGRPLNPASPRLPLEVRGPPSLVEANTNSLDYVHQWADSLHGDRLFYNQHASPLGELDATHVH